MTFYEILRYARNMNALSDERYKSQLSLAYMGAALQRAKKLPKLKSLLKGDSEQSGRPMSLQEVLQRFKQAPVYTKKG
ncbi:MAG: hypothetical protein AAF468_20195 [Pseudomonadota bacterium]